MRYNERTIRNELFLATVQEERSSQGKNFVESDVSIVIEPYRCLTESSLA